MLVKARYLCLMGLAVGLMPRGASAINPTRCVTSVYCRASTCECLQQEIPTAHLVGKVVDGACPFQTPPPGFDPSRASHETLDSWGIPYRDAAELKDPNVRAAYFHGVVRAYGGRSCNQGACGAPIGTTWHPPDGAKWDLPGSLIIHCWQCRRLQSAPDVAWLRSTHRQRASDKVGAQGPIRTAPHRVGAASQLTTCTEASL